ncbi:MAG: HrpE/YscL family type III secretion apparatus protein [Pyrinomonas sp.]|uniref:type III secretion system stator protein SctL n=1 Tax=Pyrinomonas sp. TaxID=2080306 RepID=UPI00332A4FA0
MNAVKVIKRDVNWSDGEGRPVIKRVIVEARAEARRIVEEATREAELIREEALAEAERIRETARREAQEGALAELHELLINARERREAAIVQAERDLLRLAVRIAEKIIGRELRTDPAAIADIVATALRHARQQEMLTVRVNPADAALVQRERERIDPMGRARFLDVVADPRIASGGCVIETESGTIDARLETQLRALERALLAQAVGEER